MKFSYILKTAFWGFFAHKSRSFLTILGIVIGITSIILIMSLGKGAQDLILNQIRGMGSAIIDINPGKEPEGLSDFAEIFSDSLKIKDYNALQNPSNVTGIKRISPAVSLNSSVIYQNESKRTLILGGNQDLFAIFDVQLIDGRFITEQDVKQKALVAVLGSTVREKLFDSSDALGEKIKIKNKNFRVIGVAKKKGTSSMLDLDDIVAIPYTTAQQYLLGIDHFHSISVQAESEEIIPRVVRDIELTLREQHNITDPEKDDFHVTTQADAMETVGIVMVILTLFLSAIAAISLIVGGIGIMNIMLVSVVERTKEIGLRKAIGATDKNILLQFLTESVILTCIGGVIGIALGVGFAFLSSLILSKVVSLGWVFTVSPNSILLGLSVAGFVGIVFGIYPAWSASQKSPIEALRYE